MVFISKPPVYPMGFQDGPKIITWKILLKSPPNKVFEYLVEDESREKWWVESSQQEGDTIKFTFPNGWESDETIIAMVENRSLEMTYLGSRIRYDIKESDAGTILTVTDFETTPEYRVQVIAGWGSVLMALKGAVDFGIDLRNHRVDYTWEQGFFDN